MMSPCALVSHSSKHNGVPETTYYVPYKSIDIPTCGDGGEEETR